jgi:hypothetical protein
MRKKPQRPTKQIAMVKWHDAHADFQGSWIHESDINPEPLEVTSIGIVLEEVKPGHVTLTQSYIEGICDNILHIPESMVRDITIIAMLEIGED